MSSSARRSTARSAHGGAKRQYCRIVHWLEDESPELARAFHITCLEIKLHPRRDDPGVTLLYPDEDLRKEIIAAAEDDTEKAVKLLGNLVLLNHFGTASDFASKTPGTLNRLSYEAAVEGNVVKLGGATATRETKFAPTENFEGRIAVWRVKGKLALPTKPFTAQAVPAAERAPRQKTGNGERKAHGGAPGDSPRKNMAEAVEASMKLTLDTRGEGLFNPYLSAVVSILKVMGPRAATVAPYLDYNPVICFYVLVEPHLTDTSQALIPDEIFGDPALSTVGGVVPRLHAGPPVQEFLDFFAGLNAAEARADAARTDETVRYGCNMLSSCAEAVACITAAYEERAAKEGRPGTGLRDMHRDEFRFRLRQTLLGLYNKAGPWRRAAPSGEDFCTAVGNFVKYDMPGNSLGDELQICKGTASTREAMGALLLFTRATCLLYKAWPLECLDLKAPAGSTASGSACWRRSMLDPGLEEGLTFNYHYATYQDLMSWGPNVVIGGGSGSGGAGGLSPAAMAELRAIVRKTGGPPPDVLALGAGTGGAGEDSD